MSQCTAVQCSAKYWTRNTGRRISITWHMTFWRFLFVSVLFSAHAERFSVSRMRDFLKAYYKTLCSPPKFHLLTLRLISSHSQSRQISPKRGAHCLKLNPVANITAKLWNNQVWENTQKNFCKAHTARRFQNIHWGFRTTLKVEEKVNLFLFAQNFIPAVCS